MADPAGGTAMMTGHRESPDTGAVSREGDLDSVLMMIDGTEVRVPLPLVLQHGTREFVTRKTANGGLIMNVR